MQGEWEATTATHSTGVRLLSPAAVGVKQTGRNHSSAQLQPEFDSPNNISPIPAKRRRKRRGRKHQLGQAQAATAVIHAATVQHDSCELIVVSAVLDWKHCCDVLIDPGSSSNFVRRGWAMASGMTLQPLAKALQVTLADDKVAARLDAAVSVTSLTVQGSKAPCTLTVMDHLSHEIIIGLPWLRKAWVQLGCDKVMTWNGRRMYPVMLDGRHHAVQLQGLEVAPEHEARLGKLLQRFRAAFSKELRKRSAAALDEL